MLLHGNDQPGVAGGPCDVSFGDPEHSEGEDERHGAGVEEAFDNIDGELGAESKAGFLRDEVGADGVGDAADEGDGRESYDLGSDKGEGRDLFMVLEEAGPAEGAKNVGEIDAEEADEDLAPVGLGDLFTEDVEIEVEFLPAPEEECCEGGEHEQAQDPLLLFQAFSVSGRHFDFMGKRRVLVVPRWM